MTKTILKLFVIRQFHLTDALVFKKNKKKKITFNFTYAFYNVFGGMNKSDAAVC